MARTISVTEARDNLPALVRQVNASGEALIITSRNQPRAVIVDYETFQRKRELQEEGARSLLNRLLGQAEQFVESTLEGYRPDSLELSLFLETFQDMARALWEACRLLDKPRRMLAVNLMDAVLNFRESGEQLTPAHLKALAEILPLLQREDLTIDEVAEADRQLLAAGLDAVFPIEGDLASLYEEPAGDTL